MKAAITLLYLAASLAAQTRTGNLRCEDRVNPLGIDSTTPRLSWILTASPGARDVRQTAYEIHAATSREALASGTPDLWASGRIASDQSIHAAYAGKPLAEGAVVYWKVRVWDQTNQASAWSEPAQFSIGLLHWTGQWIGQDEAAPYHNPASPFRHLRLAKWIWAAGAGPRTFTASLDLPAGRKVKRAQTVIDADAGFELTLNGRAVGRSTGVRSPMVWDIDRFLKPGANAIQVTAQPARQRSGMIAAFVVEFASGDPVTLTTSASWTSTTALEELGPYGMQPWGEVGYQEERALPARHLRKEFTVKSGLRRATAYVSGLGLFELHLNGNKVSEDVLQPNLTDYDKRTFYRTYDVTSRLTPGANALGVLLGNGRYWAPRDQVPIASRNFGYPKAILKLHLEYADGSSDDVVTDTSWKISTTGPIRANNEYDGEEYDARAELAGWSRAGYNDARWAAAQPVDPPKGPLVAQMAEPLRVIETIRAATVKQLRPGVFIYDMGQNMVGWVRLSVRGPRGTQVRLRHSETLTPEGELYTDNLRSALATDFYTLSGAPGGETWEPRFTYHGFRYVEVTGFPDTPTLASLQGRIVADALTPTADFVSSNATLNQLHANILRGVRGNYRSIPTDCPQRDERQGWLGDRSVVSRSESYLHDVAAFYAKWETDIADAQRPNGSIPDVAPNYWVLYNDDVTWPSTFLQVPVMLYDQYADLRTVERHYPAMKRWIEYMRGFVKDGVLPKDTYGDWCVPPEDPKLIHSQDPARKTDGTLLATAYFYMMNRQMARFAHLLHQESDANQFETFATQLRVAFHAKFFNPQTGYYGNGTQTSSILPLVFGMVPEENRATVLASLVKKIEQESAGHVGTGLVGAQWLMRALTENGRGDLALTIATQKTYPGWGYMLSKGATTVWELWNGDTADPAMNSGNHVMQIGDLGVWMYEYLAGIRPDPDDPAFHHVVIRPYTLAGLTSVKASHISPYGKVVSAWKRDAGAITLDVTIPPNTHASVWVPGADKPVEIGSGTYTFKGK